jgi:hypothetical protein
MGIFELLVYIVVICLLGAGANWLIATFAAAYAGVGYKAILAVVVVSILFVLLSAFGITGFDPQIPQFGHHTRTINLR